MPADPARVGTGARRQGDTEPDRTDDSNPRLDRELEADGARQETGAGHERGRQPGAHGNDSPHRNVKPGTRDALKEVERAD